MSWRTIVISNNAKLDYQMGYLVIRKDKVLKVHISEIGMIIIETTAVSLTAVLLAELVKHKIKVIFCDEKRNPLSELVPYYGSHDTSLKVRTQVQWDEHVKKGVWTEIVAEKIRKQEDLLRDIGHEEEARMLSSYIREMQFADATNREGHAAKVYFNSLFGKDFSRTQDNSINAALNYGYSIILSCFTREIVANGFITQLGLFHNNMFNQFNLASDLMEPFRALVDRRVYHMKPDVFEHAEKMQLVDVLNTSVIINNRDEIVSNAVKIYCKSVFDALCGSDISLIKFYRYEL